ncbi:tyrosine-type recombinase/integrase [Rapidithrix thailandica]|uniref:Tyrosine recombinase XerC n=1 Tax=Rapidithrix thailandica TaxID=413964 RepID=A0AAW9SE91_9BACT
MLASYLNFLKYERRASQHTLQSYQNDLQQFEKFCLEQNPEFALERAEYYHIRAWVIQLMEKQYNPRSVNRKIASLNAFYKFLLQKKIIEKSPTQKLLSLKYHKNLPVFIKKNETEQLFDPSNFKKDLYGQRDLVVMELLYGTGIRLSELTSLKISAIDFNQKTLKVLGKNNKERLIPIHKNLLNLLKNYVDLINGTTEGYLITTKNGKKAYPMMIYRIANKYLGMNTSVEKRSPHTMRHTFATHLLNEGADLNAIKDLLGHANLAATQIYTHNSLERIKKVFEQAHPKSK